MFSRSLEVADDPVGERPGEDLLEEAAGPAGSRRRSGRSRDRSRSVSRRSRCRFSSARNSSSDESQSDSGLTMLGRTRQDARGQGFRGSLPDPLIDTGRVFELRSLRGQLVEVPTSPGWSGVCPLVRLQGRTGRTSSRRHLDAGHRGPAPPRRRSAGASRQIRPAHFATGRLRGPDQNAVREPDRGADQAHLPRVPSCR